MILTHVNFIVRDPYGALISNDAQPTCIGNACGGNRNNNEKQLHICRPLTWLILYHSHTHVRKLMCPMHKLIVLLLSDILSFLFS